MKKILILSNHHTYTYNFRKEIIQSLLDNNYKVYLVLPYGEKVDKLIEMGCKFIDLPLDRRGMDPLTDLKLLKGYYRIIKDIKPDAVLSYTVKPNVYGGLLTRFLKIPFYPNVTGLGSAVESTGFFQKVLLKLHKFALKKATCVFFQNKANLRYFWGNKIVKRNHQLIPGSGVNLEDFPLLDYPIEEKIRFVFISRIMKQKGIDLYLEAAKHIKNIHPYTEFHVCGFCEEEYEYILKEYEEKGIIIYHGMVDNVKNVMENIHCTIHPTYYPEGMSNVLLESASSGRPVITTRRSGCKEVVDDGQTGFIIDQESSKELIEKVKKFLSYDYDVKRNMGILGRKKMNKQFDRQIIVDFYIKEINSLFI